MVKKNSVCKLDELNAPAWLNAQFFEDILNEKQKGESVKISKLVIRPGATKNDHYASIMFRAIIDYSLVSQNGELQEKHQSLIIKTMPEADGQDNELLAQYDLFQIETRMYSETLPKIEKILNEHGDQTKLCANLFYYALKPHKCIIFEDLVELGFATIANRHCNMNEVKATLEKVAKLHAVSFKLAKEDDTSVTCYTEGLFSKERVIDMEFCGGAIKLFKEVIAKYDDLRVYLPLVEKFEPTIFQRIMASYNTYNNGERKGIFTLNHGDLHLKNMMIQQTHGKLSDVMLVDYQLCYFGPSALDVIFAIITLFSPEMRLKHRDELVYHYFTQFQATLRLIGYKERLPTLLDFQHELLKHAHFELYLSTSIILLNYTFSSSDGDLSKLLESKDYRRELLQRPDVLKELRVLLTHFLHKGYFEIQ